MKVYVLIDNHRHGDFISVHQTHEQAVRDGRQEIGFENGRFDDEQFQVDPDRFGGQLMEYGVQNWIVVEEQEMNLSFSRLLGRVQRDAVLAGLRLLQREFHHVPFEIQMIAGDSGSTITADQIDKLCEEINS